MPTFKVFDRFHRRQRTFKRVNIPHERAAGDPMTRSKSRGSSTALSRSGSRTSAVSSRSAYSIQECLGKGGFAVVYRVHRRGQELGVDVAMRVVPLDKAMEDPRLSTVKLLRKRMEWAKQLPYRQEVKDDPSRIDHILMMLDYKITPNSLLTFQQVCHREDLFQHIVDSPDAHLAEEEAREITRALCKAVAQVHRFGCIHRDIKAENCLYKTPLKRPIDIVLADFGCAICDTTAQSYHTGAAGSPGYVSPEMCASKAYNMLIDEWGLGIVVYEMLTGRAVWQSDTPSQLAIETLENDVRYPARYWRHISQDAVDFVQSFLVKDPRYRMTAEKALEHAWLATDAALPDHSENDGCSAAVSRRSTDKTVPLANRRSRLSVYQASALQPELAGDSTAPLQATTAHILAGDVPEELTTALQAVDSGSDKGETEVEAEVAT